MPITGPLRFYHAIAWGLAISCIGYAGYGIWRNYTDPVGFDFVSFWAAAKLAFQGQSALAYDIAAHRSVELSAGPITGLLAFAYPPPFLLMILPLGIPPFWLSFAIWVMVTGAIYALATRSLIKGPYALANPAAHFNALNGQNGFLTAGLFIGGTALLDRRPVLAGAILGLLCIKPQLALLIPVALVAGGQWRALGAAAGSAATLIVLSAAAFGIESYRAFFDMLPTYVELMQSSRLPMHQVASVYALLRLLHLPEVLSLAGHVVVAVIAAGATWLAWARNSEARVPILAASSLLISPYLFGYDTLLLTVPIAFLLMRGELMAASLIWVLSLASFAWLLTGWNIPNIHSIAAIVSLSVLHRNARVGRQLALRLAG